MLLLHTISYSDFFKAGTMPLNQKQPPQKQANSQKPVTSSTAHPGYQSMAHVYPSQATSTAKQMVQNVNRPVNSYTRIDV